jgi:hypothetical protein
MKFSPIMGAAVLSLTLFSCSKDIKNNNRAGIDPAPANQAPTNITETLAPKKVEVKNDLNVDKAHVVLKKAGLGKELLLSANMLTQGAVAQFSGLQSRVVSFHLKDKEVVMLDVTKNNFVSPENNIPQAILLAKFPVFSETDDSLEIDFNSGMSQIFVAGDWFTSDYSSFSGEAELKLPSAEVRLSYLDEVSVQDKALFIRQVAQIAGNNEVVPVEVRYQLKAYKPDPNFVPVESPGFSKVGYFEANPLLLKDGSTRVYAAKWHDKKTIKFAVSANTPKKYRELIKNALLYWNKVLGENKIEVTQLEDKNITAPRFDMNIIQWVDNDASGSAFADAQVDPRSGEVTSAQIFFPSAFFQSAVARRVRLIQQVRPHIGLKGFKSSQLCNRDIAKEFLNRESVQVSPEAMQKAVEDYVYEVVAHELGHVLGLRHNFAGNLAANYDYKDRKDLIMSYYTNKKAPMLGDKPVITSSSVMEYSRFEESAFNGDQLRTGGPALSYDVMAINYLYKEQALPKENRPVFCTDSDVAIFADCNKSDAGRSVVSAASGSYQAGLNSLAAKLVNQYIMMSKLADDVSSGLVPVSQVSLNATNQAKAIAADLGKLVSTLKSDAAFIAVRSPRLPVLATMKSEIEQLEKEYVQSEFDRLGTMQELLKAIPADYDAQLNAKFATLLEDPLYNSGIAADGKTYSFSQEEKTVMKAQVAIFSRQVKEELILNELNVLSGASIVFSQTYGQEAAEKAAAWSDSDLTYELSHLNLARFQQYALSKKEEAIKWQIKMKDGTDTELTLPEYLYPQSIRLASAKLFSNAHKAIDWGYLDKQKAAALVDAELAIMGDISKLDLSTIDRRALQWYLNNKKLESGLLD